MLLQHCLNFGFLIGLLVLGAGVACGQDYPNRPLRMVAAGTPGSGGDFVARLVAQGLTGSLGQQIIVDNRPAVIAPETVAKATADGYTLLVYSGALWTAPLLEKMPYDPVRDFSLIILVSTSPNILVINPSVAATSVKELIALAKSKPGALNYSSAETGGTAHLGAELFKSMAGVNIVRIPYKSGALALNDLINGQVQVNFASAGAVAPHLKSGRVRPLAVTSPAPSSLFPGMPTVAASGLPGFESIIRHIMIAPAKTPVAIIKRLNQETVRVLNDADVKEKFFNSGLEVVGSSPEQLAATMKSEMARLGKLIKDANIRAD